MNLQPINVSASPEVQMTENFETLEHQAVYGKRQPVTTGLTWGYCGGRWGGFSIAAGTLALTDDDDNYIVVEIATGDISVDTATTDWADDANFVRVYKITTADGVVTAVEDHRAGTGGVHGGGGGGGGGGGITALTGDVTASGSGSVAATIANDAVTYAKMQNVSATARVLGRKTASAGDTEEVTLSELLDFIGSAAQGDILYRGSSAWARLAAGTSGQVLQTQGAGANPQWATPSGGGTKTYAVFTPMTSQPPASNYATLDARNSIAVLDYDASNEETAFWVGIMPEGASLGSGLKVRIHWLATSATSGDVKWGAAFEAMTTDLDSDSYDTETTGTSTTSGTSGIETVTEITCTTIDSIAAGGMYRLKIARKAADGADTMTGDAEIVAVEVRSAA